ncbi:MAG: transcription termination/antitermination protein NusG [Endomicrobium sp.]|jgi:transcriptional antiterminator NusG|nr:transcription termination/antitermination protein NusG [Endomicrobium sp.]
MLKQWYIVHTYSGYEDKVKNRLEVAISNLNMSNIISKIIIPTEEIILIKNNKKNIKKRKFYPGYVFIEMNMNTKSYWIVMNILGVTGFLGGTKPIPMLTNEVTNLLNNLITAENSKPKPAISFDKEENVRIIEGPFKHFVGTVEEVNHEKGKLKIMVTIFGRPTPVELDFLQVEKI